MRSLLPGSGQSPSQSKRLGFAVAVILSTFVVVALLAQRTSQANSVVQSQEGAGATKKASESQSHEHHQDVNKPASKPTEKPDMSNMQHRHGDQPAQTNRDMSKTDDQHAAHNHADAHGGHDMNAMMSTVMGGPFKSMTAIGSGTSLMPASAPGYMWHWMKGDWMIMTHGELKLGLNHQGGPRGINKAESQNWLMLMAERRVGGGSLMLRGMFSAEPWTAPRRGFPELFQTGETFGGRPIIDAQHAHDLFMELAASYTHPLSENVSIHLYGGPVGEPSLGPVA
ncbi:MAG TPA: hypothetical protein VNI02_09620, partial [Blastocatellia bacterium]|nr:hypothetical protein [Blastocatellia bacterium]